MLKLTKDDPVWTLDFGEGENRFSPDWLTRFEAVLDDIEGSSEAIVLVTIGSGKFYSNGLDLDWLGAHLDQHQHYLARVHQIFARVLTLPIPTVAALNGHAFAAGAMLALAHDYRVMRSDRGYFCLPEVDLGLPFTPGMNALITSKLSPRAAADAMITGRRYPAAEALTAGIVDATAPLDSVRDTAAGLVRDLAGKDRATLCTIKARLYADAVAALHDAHAVS